MVEFIFIFLPVATAGTVAGTLVFGIPLEAIGVQWAYCYAHIAGIILGAMLGNSACAMAAYELNTFEYIGMMTKRLRRRNREARQ